MVSTLQPLTIVLNYVAMLIKNLTSRDRITPTIRELHCQHIQFYD